MSKALDLLPAELTIRHRRPTGRLDDGAGPPAVRYCLDDGATDGIKRRRWAGRHYEPSTLGAILTTARRGADAIGAFTLTVARTLPDTDPSDVPVAFCPLEARRISPAELRWSARSFKPDRRPLRD